MDKMPYTLTQWKQSSSQVSEQSLLRIAEGCLSAALHLQQLGIDLEALSESDVYIDK